MTSTAAFDAVAGTYDEVFTNSPVGRAQRDAVWSEIDRAFTPGDHVLEINCGTGEDAIHMAQRGLDVFACDASSRMVNIARLKASALTNVSLAFAEVAIEDLSRVEPEHKFDGVLSNFSGLNCVGDLPAVARDLARLVRPGGTAIICLFGRYCAWEIAWYLAAARPRKALRRLTSHSIEARLDDASSVIIRYPGTREITRSFAPWFRLRRRKGIGLFVPPTFADALARRHPRIIAAGRRLDRVTAHLPLVRSLADHQLFVFQRTAIEPRTTA